MKKVIKSRLFVAVITMIICISGTLYAANKYQASEVVYNKKDGTSTNVNDALNELYQKKNSLEGPILIETYSNAQAHALSFLYDVSNILTLSYSSSCVGENSIKLYYSNTRPDRVNIYETNVGNTLTCGNATLDVSNYKYLNITVGGTTNYFKIVSYS